MDLLEKKQVKLKAIDFFCGAGGMTYGLKQAGIDVLAGVDIDIGCKETYEKNNPNSKFITNDIRELGVNIFETEYGISVNDSSLLLVCCSPCQYWTKLNTDKKRSSQSKDLIKEFARFTKYFLPGYILMENVPGLYNRKEESGLSFLLNFFEESGYHCEYEVINTNSFGVPQNRKRFVLIASRIDKKISLPEKELEKNNTVRNFIGCQNRFPEISDNHKDPTPFMHTTMRLSEKNRARIQLTRKDGGTRIGWKDHPDLQINAYKGKDSSFRDVYGRMFWDKPAPTITTRFPSLSNGRFGHPEQDRAISLREGATLQTFPRDYSFIGSSESAIARQIGNAVPPELAKRLGESIVRSWTNANIQS